MGSSAIGLVTAVAVAVAAAGESRSPAASPVWVAPPLRPVEAIASRATVAPLPSPSPSPSDSVATSETGDPGTAPAAADDGAPAEGPARPTFIQVDRWCTATAASLSSPGAPNCPAAAATADLYAAWADAGTTGPSIFVAASARAPVGVIAPSSQATSVWMGRTLRESNTGGPVRVLLTGVAGRVTADCDGCVLTGGVMATASAHIRYTDAGGNTVSRHSWCFIEAGRPVPASIALPDDCAGDTFEVPAATPVWIELYLYAFASTASTPTTAARLQVGSATVEMP